LTIAAGSDAAGRQAAAPPRAIGRAGAACKKPPSKPVAGDASGGCTSQNGLKIPFQPKAFASSKIPSRILRLV